MISPIPVAGRLLGLLCALGWPVMASAHSVTLAFGVHSTTDQSIVLRTYHAATGELLDITTLSLVIHDHPVSAPLVVIGSTGWDPLDPALLVIQAYDAISGVYQWTGRLRLSADEHERPVSLVHSEPSTPLSTYPITFILRARHPETHVILWETHIDRRSPLSRLTQTKILQTFSPTAIDCMIVQIDPPHQIPHWVDAFDPFLVVPEDPEDASDEPVPFVPIRHQSAHL